MRARDARQSPPWSHTYMYIYGKSSVGRKVISIKGKGGRVYTRTYTHTVQYSKDCMYEWMDWKRTEEQAGVFVYFYGYQTFGRVVLL